jgi:adenylyltransferase/sulfurtransferase
MESVGKKGQEKLKNASVFIGGAGGLGSPISILLAAAGIGKICIVDDGLVEASNLNRQILYRQNDIGHLKSMCAKKTLEELNPYITIEAVNKRISKDNAIELVGNSDIIIDALDNFSTRYLLNQAAFEKGVPLVHGAVEGLTGQATTIVPSKTNCLQCILPKGPSDQTWPIISVTCGFIASIQANEVIKHILGLGSLLVNRLLLFDGFQTKVEELKLEPTPACPICNKSDILTDE